MYTGLTSPLTITGLDQVSGGSAGYSTTKYAYDTQNRLVSTTDPLDQTESYTYDSKSGRLLTKTDRNDVVTTYTYDNLGRETRREAGTGDYVATTYTLSGQKASESNAAATTAYTYDDMGRLTAEVTGDAVKTYSYNLGGARTAFAASVDGASQISLAYTYDAMNRLSTVSGNSTSASYGYTDNGNLEYVQYGNGLREEYAYNKANLLTGLVNELDNTVLSQYGYTYTLDGQQVQKTEPNNKVTAYTYDGYGRLMDEAVTLNSVLQQSYAYTYDAFGNRIGLEATGTDAYETAYTYDANNRLLEETKDTAGLTEIATYYYDANGNQTAKVNSTLQNSADPAAVALSQGVADSELMGYNGFNELTSVAKGEDEITYAYLPSGLRLSKTADAATTSFVWDGSNTVLELTGTAVTAKYLRGTNLVSSVIGGTTSYYLYNGHGDVVQLANAAGAVTKTYDYDAFGVEQSPSETDANPYRYCGEYYDKETGTYYLRARYYSPSTGRFTQEDTHWNTGNMVYGDEREMDSTDPLGLNMYTHSPDINAVMQSGNLYVYAVNNPLAWFDPSGEVVVGYGGSANAALGIRGEVQAIRVRDDKGNKGTLIVFGIGGGTPSLGGSFVHFSDKDTDTIYDLGNEWNEPSCTVGGSIAGLGGDCSISFEGDVTASLAFDKKVLKKGFNLLEVEIHGVISRAVMIPDDATVSDPNKYLTPKEKRELGIS